MSQIPPYKRTVLQEVTSKSTSFLQRPRAAALPTRKAQTGRGEQIPTVKPNDSEGATLGLGENKEALVLRCEEGEEVKATDGEQEQWGAHIFSPMRSSP